MKSDDVKCIADYARFISDTYVELDTLRYTTVQKPVHEIAEFMIMSWPVIQGTSNQLRIKRIAQQEYNIQNVMRGSKILDGEIESSPWTLTTEEKPNEHKEVLLWPSKYVAVWIKEFDSDNGKYDTGFYRDSDVSPIDESECVYWMYFPSDPE